MQTVSCLNMAVTSNMTKYMINYKLRDQDCILSITWNKLTNNRQLELVHVTNPKCLQLNCCMAEESTSRDSRSRDSRTYHYIGESILMRFQEHTKLQLYHYIATGYSIYLGLIYWYENQPGSKVWSRRQAASKRGNSPWTGTRDTSYQPSSVRYMCHARIRITFKQQYVIKFQQKVTKWVTISCFHHSVNIIYILMYLWNALLNCSKKDVSSSIINMLQKGSSL